MQQPNIANTAVNLLLRWQLLDLSVVKVPAEHKTKRIQPRNIKHLNTIEYMKNSSLYIIAVCLAPVIREKHPLLSKTNLVGPLYVIFNEVVGARKGESYEL